MNNEKALKLAKKIKEQAELFFLNYEKEKYPKARYIDLYDWSCALVRELKK